MPGKQSSSSFESWFLQFGALEALEVNIYSVIYPLPYSQHALACKTSSLVEPLKMEAFQIGTSSAMHGIAYLAVCSAATSHSYFEAPQHQPAVQSIILYNFHLFSLEFHPHTKCIFLLLK